MFKFQSAMKNTLALLSLCLLWLVNLSQDTSTPFVFKVKSADTLDLMVATAESPTLDRMMFRGGGSWWPVVDEETTLSDNQTVYPSIDLSGQGLRTIPFDYCVESWVGKYDLSNNDIRKLTKRFGKVSTDSLDLSGNQIATLKPGCLYFRLVYLNLSRNNITKLPFGIDFGYRLEHLDLSHNQLEYLPNSIYAQQLHTLNLEGNVLDRLPSKLRSAAFLEELNLSGNEFKVVPSIIPYFDNLVDLDLSNNQITRLPSKLKRMYQLRTLDLRGNPLQPEAVERFRILMPQCTILF
jgi:Leucine-rich repeat (LRR) protein